MSKGGKSSFAFFAVLCTPSLLLASESGGVGAIDYGVLGLYILGTIFLGYFISKKKQSRSDYFTGGGNMSSILIGVSLFATLLSTISYLGMPGEAAGKGGGGSVYPHLGSERGHVGRERRLASQG